MKRLDKKKSDMTSCHECLKCFTEKDFLADYLYENILFMNLDSLHIRLNSHYES